MIQLMIFIYALGVIYAAAKQIETLRRKEIYPDGFGGWLAYFIAVGFGCIIWPWYLGTMSERRH